MQINADPRIMTSASFACLWVAIRGWACILKFCYVNIISHIIIDFFTKDYCAKLSEAPPNVLDSLTDRLVG